MYTSSPSPVPSFLAFPFLPFNFFSTLLVHISLPIPLLPSLYPFLSCPPFTRSHSFPALPLPIPSLQSHYPFLPCPPFTHSFPALPLPIPLLPSLYPFLPCPPFTHSFPALPCQPSIYLFLPCPPFTHSHSFPALPKTKNCQKFFKIILEESKKK